MQLVHGFYPFFFFLLFANISRQIEDGKAQNFILHVFILLLSPSVIFNKFGFLSKICSKMLFF